METEFMQIYGLDLVEAGDRVRFTRKVWRSPSRDGEYTVGDIKHTEQITGVIERLTGHYVFVRVEKNGALKRYRLGTLSNCAGFVSIAISRETFEERKAAIDELKRATFSPKRSPKALELEAALEREGITQAELLEYAVAHGVDESKARFSFPHAERMEMLARMSGERREFETPETRGGQDV